MPPNATLAAEIAAAVISELRRRGPEPLAVGEVDAARMLGVSARTLFALRQAGQVPHTRIGERVLYPVAELREWLAEKSTIKSIDLISSPVDGRETAVPATPCEGVASDQVT